MNIAYLGVFFILLLFIVIFIKGNEKKSAIERFGEKDLISSAGGVYILGEENSGEKFFIKSGFLLIFKNGLYFRTNFIKREYFLAAENLLSIDLKDYFNAERLVEPCLIISFIDSKGSKKRLGLRIPHPHKFIKIIKSCNNYSKFESNFENV